MARNQKRKNTNNSYRPNFWGFLQNVLIAALNKGQLLLMGLIVFFLIIVIKIPSDEILPFIKGLLDISKINSILGWVFAFLITFGSFFINRYQRKIHTIEIKRISEEKRKLQEKLSQTKLPSSNKR